jgi:hypothetical protein
MILLLAFAGFVVLLSGYTGKAGIPLRGVRKFKILYIQRLDA